MKDQSYQSGTTRIDSCINSILEMRPDCVSLVFPAWYHCVGGVSRQVRMTLYPPLITFFVAIFSCQDEFGRSSSWPQCPVSELKQGTEWQSFPLLSTCCRHQPGGVQCAVLQDGWQRPRVHLVKIHQMLQAGKLGLRPVQRKSIFARVRNLGKMKICNTIS